MGYTVTNAFPSRRVAQESVVYATDGLYPDSVFLGATQEFEQNGYSYYTVDYQVPVILFSGAFANFDVADAGGVAVPENAGPPLQMSLSPVRDNGHQVLNAPVHNGDQHAPVVAQG